MNQFIAIIIVSLFFLVGLLGTILPVLPGAPLIWIGMLLYGLMVGFDSLGIWFMIAQAALALTVIAIDYIFSAFGSRYFGGSKAAFWGAGIGLAIGVFFFPAGLLIGPFLGATIADLIFRKDSNRALKAGIGASVGFLGAYPVKLFIEIVMITWFMIRII